MKRRKPSYFEITATEMESYQRTPSELGYRMNWYILSGPHATFKEADNAGREKIGPTVNEYGISLGAEVTTRYRNLTVVSRTQLIRRYGLDPDNWGDEEY